MPKVLAGEELSMRSWLLGYYADDFTGATDAMEWLERAGVSTLLTMRPPDQDLLARFPDKQALGIAGLTRAAPTEAIAELLRPALTALRDLSPQHIHYKVCSTFDSSPSVGSIGRAMEVAVDTIPGPFVALVVGAPQLGRYCVFGNLFARMGIDSDGGIYRLDRHPAMMAHPTTPADESDLLRHLGKQTSLHGELMDVLQLDLPLPQRRAALDALLQRDAQVVLFDALTTEHLTKIGQLLDERARQQCPLLSFGSSAIELALANTWTSAGDVTGRATWPPPEPAERLLVLSGSCSLTTSQQIQRAIDQGHTAVPLDVACLGSEEQQASEVARVAEALAVGLKQAGRAIVFTNPVRQDPSTSETRRSVPPSELGTMLADVGRTVIRTSRVTRLCIAGGDTCGYVARALGIDALELVRPQVAGAPLCRVVAGDPDVLGLEVVFKGGQVGAPNYFDTVAESGATSSGEVT